MICFLTKKVNENETFIFPENFLWKCRDFHTKIKAENSAFFSSFNLFDENLKLFYENGVFLCVQKFLFSKSHFLLKKCFESIFLTGSNQETHDTVVRISNINREGRMR